MYLLQLKNTLQVNHKFFSKKIFVSLRRDKRYLRHYFQTAEGKTNTQPYLFLNRKLREVISNKYTLLQQLRFFAKRWRRVLKKKTKKFRKIRSGSRQTIRASSLARLQALMSKSLKKNKKSINFKDTILPVVQEISIVHPRHERYSRFCLDTFKRLKVKEEEKEVKKKKKA